MSASAPATAKEATTQRASSKRRITNLLKQSNALLGCSEGISHTEFLTLATQIRERLDVIQTDNDWVIKLKCQELDVTKFADDAALEAAEDNICTKEEKYLSDLTDGVFPTISQLLKTAEKLRPTPPPDQVERKYTLPPDKDKMVATRMAKLKFPTFSGDLREYRRFRELFAYFSRHLTDIERLYQLVESMDRNDEKKKIKTCSDIGRAWEILDEAYGDPDRLLERLINDIENIHSYESSVRGSSKYDLRSMERFVETLQNFTTQVEGLGMKGDLNGRMLLTQVRRSLPEEHRIQFLQSVNDGKAIDSMPGLVKWLHSLLVLLQKAQVTGPTNQQKSHYQSTSTSNPTSSGFRARKSVSYSTMSPGDTKSDTGMWKANSDNLPPKCPLHPSNSNHYIKGCHKFRTLTQGQKFDILNSNNICHRCGHNNCIAGKRPFNHDDCQFIVNCQIPSCGMNTHFTSICPHVYGIDGYRHYDKKFVTNTVPKSTSISGNLNPGAYEYEPTQKTTSAAENRIEDSDKIVCALPTIMGYLRHDSKRILVRILLDTGSQISLVREGVISKSTDCHMQDFSLTTVGGDTISRKLRVVDCILEGLDGTFVRNVCLTEMETPCGKAPIVTNTQIKKYSHLDKVTIVEAPDDTVDILLGVDNGDLLITEENILGSNPNDPVAVKCPLGWYVQGGHRTDDVLTNAIVNFTQVSAVSEIEEFLGIERMGLEPKQCRCTIEDEDKIATASMQQSVTQLVDGTYQISLPWKKSPQDLPNNYTYALKRFYNLEKQFKDKPREWAIYCKQMEDQVTRGVARVVPDVEIRNDIKEGKNMWFLPHFAVVKNSETTPVRVVYDGKARYQGHSLNDYLAKGDNLNTSLFDVALRFREYEVGVIADISKMFQTVRITPDDARFHRYIFRKHINDPVTIYELTTVTFGDKPSPTAATIALRHVAKENAPDDLDIERVVREQFYVDDLNDSQRTVADTERLKERLIDTLNRGKFNIRKWLSNAETICDPEFYPSDGIAMVLGTRWNLAEDTLQVNKVAIDDSIPTKRNILKLTASYYDIFGMLSGILIRPKIILQNLWRFDMEWDTPINPDSDIYGMMENVKRDLQDVDTIRIDRCLIPKKYRGNPKLPPVSLHGASDASEDAMGIGIWLRWSDEASDDAELTFVCARARVTPLKQISMPRKELQAVLLLSRLMLAVEHAFRLEISYKRIWTDSMTAISWLRGQSKSFRSYVACRVGEITTEFDPNSDISYVPTKLNTIDLVSRGVEAKQMKQVIDGPLFLRKSSDDWPETPKNVHLSREDPELKKFHVRNAQALTLNLTKDDPIVDPNNFSSWTRLVMVTARLMSLKDLPKNQWLKKLLSKISQWPSRKRIKEAEVYWIRQAQKEIDFQNIHIMKLDPVLDEETQVYRVGGRIHNAPLSYDIRHPYLLPKKSYVGLLIAREKHRYALHGGHLRTAVEIRKTYWIIGDINLSRRVVRDCTICRRHRGKPVQQKMADLPEFRVTPCTPPFKTTIVDYLGPINVKLTRNTTSKGYCALFTCATTRAVHLTCVQDLSAPAFLQAFERFVSIRGAPALVISDNATCFRGADNKVRELVLRFDQSLIQSNGQKYDVEWKFGPPSGPHHQGAVERLVQEVKKGMKHMVKADKLSFVEWETVFCLISGLLNCRPLSAKSSSPLDEPPITPNHFLIGRGDLPCPQVPCEEYVGNFRKRRELCNTMVDGFWKRWISHIQTLSPRHKWSNERENLQIRDIVLVVDENARRGSWKLAEVVAACSGDDGLVRVVEVRPADGRVFKRPVTKLVLLMKSTERLD